MPSEDVDERTQLHIGGQSGAGPGRSALGLQDQDHPNDDLRRKDTLKVTNPFDGVWALQKAASSWAP